MSGLTNLLSMHPLLLSLCNNLSSADIVHLAATSRTDRLYVAASKPIYDLLMSKAQCDGQGIVAQAKVFGWWDGDVSRADRTCLGADAKPCVECGAQVCDVRICSIPSVGILTVTDVSVPCSLHVRRGGLRSPGR